MILNCAIIDDEPLAADLLASYVKKTPMLYLRGTYNSAITAMRDLRDNPVNLLFLDIQMPELSGLELAKILPQTTKIVFTTAFKLRKLHRRREQSDGFLYQFQETGPAQCRQVYLCEKRLQTVTDLLRRHPLYRGVQGLCENLLGE